MKSNTPNAHVKLTISRELHARAEIHAKSVHYTDFSDLVTKLLVAELKQAGSISGKSAAATRRGSGVKRAATDGVSPALRMPQFLERKKASIFSRSGRLLWTSAAWVRSDRICCFELLGLRYLEYMAPGEGDRFMRWLKSDEQVIEYDYFWPETRKWIVVRMGKTTFDADHWLCLGERLPSKRSGHSFQLGDESG